MVRRTMILGTLILTGLILAISTKIFSYPDGAPPGKTGSPGDVNTCNYCHKAAVYAATNLITSNAINGFYIPGQTYTITARITAVTTAARIGFEISPQNHSGKLLGKLVLTDRKRTQLTGKSKYITHTDSGSQAVMSMNAWAFNWIAPAAGTGEVTFYGAFMVGSTPNLVITSSLSLKERI